MRNVIKPSVFSIHPSIHPSIFYYLSGVRSWGQQPEQGFQTLIPAISFFRSRPKACNRRWGKEQISNGKARGSPFGSAPSSPRWTDAKSAWLQTAPICLSISCSLFPSLMNKIPRYLNSFTWDRISFPTWRRYFFQLRTMASDLASSQPFHTRLEVTGRSSGPFFLVTLNGPCQEGWGVWSPYRTQPPVPLLKKLYNIQGIKELWEDLVHPWGPATEELFDHFGNFSLEIRDSFPRALLPHWRACHWDWWGLGCEAS